MKYWILVLMIGSFTYLKRASFIIFLSDWEMPKWMRKSLRFVPVTIFPALVSPLIFMTDGQIDITPTNVKILSALITLIVASRFGNLLLSILVGMMILWAGQWVLG
ncbi:MAG: AzlD domain-containing protein [Chloroflexota bacterium]